MLAVCVAAGAWWSRPQQFLLVGALCGAAAVTRRPVVACAAALLVASALGARAEAGMHPPQEAAFRGTVTLLDDPADMPGGLRAVVRTGSGAHLSMSVPASSVAAVAHLLAGDRITLEGRTGRLVDHSGYLRARHVAGRLRLDRLIAVSGSGMPWRVANAVHRAVDRGAEWLPRGQRPLYRGFLIGDARGQSEVVAADMRASGLGHLLVVSGENVAFLLTLAGPALRRIGLRWRWIAVAGAVAGFAILTRAEPSVLRAVVMAAIGSVAASRGSPARPLRLLALSVAALVLVDPFLVHQIGFGLSVGATAGICVLASPLASALPGPRPVAAALATTVAAQIGVAPIAAITFGGLPAAAIPANLAAAPAAALVMVWGLPAGLLAQALGNPVAAWLQAPTRLLVGWVSQVARWSAALPLGQLRGGELVALGAATVLAVWCNRRGARRASRAAQAVLLVVALTPAWRALHPPLREAAAGATVWRLDATVVVIEPAARTGQVFDGLRRGGVRRIDLLVSRSGGLGSATVVADLRSRLSVGRILAPPGNEIRDATAARRGDRWRAGRLEVAVAADSPRLEVVVKKVASRRGAALRLLRTRAPPL